MNRRGNVQVWAEREFGGAKLGNKLRTRRLVQMAAAAAETGGGTITGALKGDPAGREGGHRLVEKHGGKHEAVGDAAAVACFRRARGLPLVLAPLDGTSLTPVSKGKPGEFGPVGNTRTPSRGLNVMHAVCLTPSGTPLGVAQQSYWARPKELRTKNRWARRKVPFEEKETVRWLSVMERTLEAKERAGFEGQVWFQADRGADFSEFLAWASTSPCWVTVRANADRNVIDTKVKKLWTAASRVEAACRYVINVPRGENRRPRKASLEVRFQEVVVALPRARDWRGVCIPITAVLVTETTPGLPRDEAIEWLLLTTKPVLSPHDAREVVKAYGFRWRIEECHKTWKSVHRVEDSQLKTAGAYALWARILFGVTLRAERLKRLSRETPDVPATTEFSETELEVMRLRWKKAKGVRNPTLGQAVEWVAYIGGYIGKSSGGPPGAIVIGRGLEFIEGAAWVLDASRAQA